MKTKMKNPQKTQKPQKPLKVSKGLKTQKPNNPKTQNPLLLPTLKVTEYMRTD